MTRRPRLPDWYEYKEARLREALLPATTRALTKDEAYRLIYISANAMTQGLSIDSSIEGILADMYNDTTKIQGFTDEFKEQVKQRITQMGLRPAKD